MARPSTFTQEMADVICERLTLKRSLRSILQDPGMPSMSGVMGWLRTNDEFAQQYARAREQQADALFDEIVDIADEAKDAQLARLQIDARKWVAGKMRPKVYGDKLDLEHTGPGGGPVLLQWAQPTE